MLRSDAEKFGIILLAAGSSSRMGRPKQLLPYQGNSLLQRSIDVAMATKVQHIVLVLGANADTIQKHISVDGPLVVVNDKWQEGIASSIRLGITTISAIDKAITGVLIMLCDQPLLTHHVLLKLLATHQATNKMIVASSYGDTVGTPAYFHRLLFPYLLLLQGDTGARSLVDLHTENLAIVPFPGGAIDIDTEDDIDKLGLK